jgi:hypothetical protein
MSTPLDRPAFLSALVGDGPFPDTEEGIADLMDRFNSLPFEERGALLEAGGFRLPPLDPWRQLTEGIEMPPAPPPGEAVEELAAAVPVLGSFSVIRAFFGAGRKLTAKGNPTVADARALAERLADPGWARRDELGGDIRGADDLPDMQFLLRWARAAGAVRVQHGKMAATDSWARLGPLDAAAKAADALLKKGPITLAAGDNRWAAGALNSVLDEGVPHLLAVLWAVPDPLPYDVLLEGVSGVCDTMLSWSPAAESWRHDRYRWSLDHLFEILARAGLAERRGEQVSTRPSGVEEKIGGEVALTRVGRAVLRSYLTSHGYPVREAGGWVDRPLADLLAHVADWHPAQTETEFECWVDRHGPQAAAAGLVAWVAGGYRDPQVPIAAVHLAGGLGPPHDETAVRALADTPARGHALAWLLDHGHRDLPVDEQAMMLAGAEMMAMTAADDPDQLIDIIDQIDDPIELIQSFAAVAGPAAELVLRTLAEHHPDPAVATAARRAAMARGPRTIAGRPASATTGASRRRDHRSAKRRRRR